VNARERVLRALRGDAVDRVPFAVWRHFYPDESEGAEKLAATTVAFTRRHQLDLVKYNPRAHYHAEPWGTAYRYRGTSHPVLARYGLGKIDRWTKIELVSLDTPAFRELLDGLRLVRAALPAIPVLATIFTPLGVLERIGGKERVLEDIEARPDEVLAATGFEPGGVAPFPARGVSQVLMAEELLVHDRVWIGAGSERHMYVVDLGRYPVDAVSWNPRLAGNPNLAAFQASVPERGAIGGFSDDAFLSDGAIARREGLEGLLQTGARRWLAAGGCTIPVESRPDAIDAAHAAVRR